MEPNQKIANLRADVTAKDNKIVKLKSILNDKDVLIKELLGSIETHKVECEKVGFKQVQLNLNYSKLENKCKDLESQLENMIMFRHAFLGTLGVSLIIITILSCMIF